ncbi:MAG TPA: DUF2207 domain-containing protein [Acidimicrobiales bacterium]|nr:DUF2207 domain-containing protein [Acidimicrobiales bacterium]
MRALRVRTMAALGAAIVAFVVLWPASPAAAKSFRIAAVQIEATLRDDASMRVVEHLTYDFDGEFHNGTRPIPRGDYEIVDVVVTEHGNALSMGGAPHDLVWHYDARDEQRTFDVAYTVIGAAKVGPDVAELYWKWVGDQHPGVGEVRVALDVPGNGLDVRAWAHGPLNGRVELQGNRILFSVTDLPPGQFVEGRVAVPSAAFGSTEPSGEARLPRILASESQLADQANQRRAREADAARRRRVVVDFLSHWYWLVPLLGWFGFLQLWARFGKEHKVPVDVGEYLREPPDDPPAIVPTLFSWGGVQPVVLSATIVDLAQRGHLKIEEVRIDRLVFGDKLDWRLTRLAKDEPVRTYEKAILERLFADGGEITQSEFEKWCKSHRTSADRWWTSVQAKVRAEYRDRHYQEGGKGLAYAGNIVLSGCVILSGIVVVSTGAWIGAVGIASGAVQEACTILIRRRTVAGARRLAEWKAFKRHLEDFSDLEEAPVGHLILWERYLVYAVALGVTAKVARALAARIPPESQSSFAPWFVGHHGPGALDSIGSLSGFAHGFGPVIVAAAHPPSSSSSGSGGGGGFSGGGGGGGGGGGIGAS